MIRRPADSMVLSRAEANRIALAAQAFALRRTAGSSPWSRVAATIDRMGLPFLQSGRFRARVDLKAERAAGSLSVRAAHLETGHDADATAAALADELRHLAS
jgi:uncharacterized protein YcaQ